ncbi:MAG TPA: hypothetical protein VK548_18925 [Candidatus Acidoferrum sp.]|nr:hypothetical protein [Candidatus Acidoferrum sp.]
MRRSTTAAILLVSALVLSLAWATPEVAAHGGNAALIHSCVNKSSGEVKIVGPNSSCKPHENAVDWPGAAPAAGVTKVLTEISLVSVLPGFANSGQGEKSRFLWEPNRYDPAPSEIFFEVVGALANGDASASVTFRLRDVTNNVDIAGSDLTILGPNTGVATGVRLRTGNLVLPATTAEIALTVQLTGVDASFSLQRSAVLLQQ